MEKRSQRFSIRKYSLGAASVLLGTAVVALMPLLYWLMKQQVIPRLVQASQLAVRQTT